MAASLALGIGIGITARTCCPERDHSPAGRDSGEGARELTSR